MRAGIGFDMHRLVSGRRLFLGGVEIPFSRGLEGHSDGDALVHAIIDALLGATGQGDIGQMFGVDDPQYAGVSSLLLLKKAVECINQEGFRVNNVDATIIAEKPRLSQFIDQMKENIAQTIQIETTMVNLKATTSKGMGVIGAEEGIAALAIVSCNLDSH